MKVLAISIPRIFKSQLNIEREGNETIENKNFRKSKFSGIAHFYTWNENR